MKKARGKICVDLSASVVEKLAEGAALLNRPVSVAFPSLRVLLVEPQRQRAQRGRGPQPKCRNGWPQKTQKVTKSLRAFLCFLWLFSDFRHTKLAWRTRI